ncbi:MAG: DUF309 domain-containing protein [Chloroflexi bacterium]|jgi:predicted metal-dependent hydrolase|uniref:Response regulatory domain-containing protein n=1 Tax=Candidatus Thermofonsia Clade 3 bacterium TaxID=2364212 RepID=A0A2M8QAW1_9CHLR|nr:DUF309 domain-containing protein [Candidatus Roseilinea sp. NK_OTU-006]PJF46953.1 MAG: hypothetical protein CUN48_11220 [Candidatus Thermofonsia Clade 3 bacterium]RMG65886.1 MAG: DUF309 domain-containing protein [Chloroflexota bacterium]
MTKRIVALVDDLFFQQPIASAAQRLGYAVEFAEPTNDVVAYLVARQPRLIVVDLNVKSLDWEGWVMAAKTSPATRKMPVLAFGSHTDAARIARARKAGCDAVVSNGAFMAHLADMIQTHARPDESEALLRQAQEPLPELARQAIAQFNAGEFWEQHETFETVWRAEPGPVRQMYQGILQVGVAYYQIQRRNYDGARKLFQRAWQYLSVLPDVCQGVDIAQLRADAQAALAELERLGPARIAEFDPALFKPIRLVSLGHPVS